MTRSENHLLNNPLAGKPGMVAATNVLLRLSPSQIGTPIPFWLAICRSIIQNHGGRLWAMPNVPRGAVFRIMLPVGEKLIEDVGRANA
jgi:hypothetical protein